MKKNFLKASAAALAALLFLPGCNREAPISDVADEVRSESIPLWFEGTESPETRVAIDGTTGVGIWTEGDRIAVWISGPGAEFYQIKPIEDIEAGNESTGHVMVTMAADQNRANFAVYPHTAAVEDHHTADDLYVTYPSEYDYSRVAAADVENYSPTPMVAINNPINHSDPTAPIPPLEFYHVGGVYRVTVKNVPSTALSLRFTFPEGMKFSGTFKVTNGGTDTASLSDIAGETYGNVITIKLPIDNPGGDMTLNIPLPYGDYTPASGADRQYKIEAFSERTLFMAVDDYVSWKGLRRAEGKFATTVPLESLGLINGMYLTRGYLNRDPVASVNPAQMSIGTDRLQAILYYNTNLDNVGKKFYFNWTELGKIMTGDSSFDGSVGFENAELTIDGVKYRVPSSLEWNMLTLFQRPGATVNGEGAKRFSKVTVKLEGSEYAASRTSIKGLLLYPDGGTFETTIANFNNESDAFTSEISYSEYRRLCNSPTGCVFLPCAGNCGNGYWGYAGSNGYYWSSTRNSSTNTYILSFNSGGIGSFGDLNKTQYRTPVRLLRE